MGASRGNGGGTDSDSDQKQRRGERESYTNSNLFLSQDGGGRSVVNASERPPQKQKSRDWDLKSVSGLASQNLFISAAASGGILSGKVGGATTVSSPSVGQYFPLGGASVLQSLFGAQAPGPATSGAPRLVNGHSTLGSFSSAGLAGGAAGGELASCRLCLEFISLQNGLSVVGKGKLGSSALISPGSPTLLAVLLIYKLCRG